MAQVPTALAPQSAEVLPLSGVATGLERDAEASPTPVEPPAEAQCKLSGSRTVSTCMA